MVMVCSSKIWFVRHFVFRLKSLLLLCNSWHICLSLTNMERLHGRGDKALENHFGGPGSIPSTGCSEFGL